MSNFCTIVNGLMDRKRWAAPEVKAVWSNLLMDPGGFDVCIGVKGNR